MTYRGWTIAQWLTNAAATLAAGIVLYGMFVVSR